MTFHAPQLILLLLALEAGLQIGLHGKPRTGKYNFVASIVSSAVLVGLLYWGGFFG